MSDTAASSGATAPFPGQPARPDKKSKRWLRWAVPLLAFLIGVGVGNSGTAPDAESQATVESAPSFVSLKSELTESQEQTAQLEDEVAEAEERIRRAGAESETRLADQAARLDERSLLLDQRESDLAARETAALRATPPSQAAPRPAAPAPYTAPAPAPAPAPRYTAPAPVAPPAASVQYFDNCSAARAAGAAPVRVGDSGYGRHLDRDGDGVGCE
jgi:hypothetical protein